MAYFEEEDRLIEERYASANLWRLAARRASVGVLLTISALSDMEYSMLIVSFTCLVSTLASIYKTSENEPREFLLNQPNWDEEQIIDNYWNVFAGLYVTRFILYLASSLLLRVLLY